MFEMTEREIKAKINTLRTYFSKELIKSKANFKSGAGTDELYVSKWPHFQSLGFLRDTKKPRKTISSLEIDDDCGSDNGQEVDSYTSDGEEISFQDEEENKEEEVSIKKSTKRSLPKKAKHTPKCKEDLLMDQAMAVLSNVGTERKVMDADETFGQYVALTLKKVANNRSKEFAKLMIQQTLYQAQFDLGIPSQTQQEPSYRMSAPLFNNPVLSPQYRQPSQNFSPTSHQSQPTFTTLIIIYI